MKRVKPDSGDDDEDLWGASNGWGDDSDEDSSGTPLAAPNGEDVSMETWIIMELCNRGSLRVLACLTKTLTYTVTDVLALAHKFRARSVSDPHRDPDFANHSPCLVVSSPETVTCSAPIEPRKEARMSPQ